MKTAKNFLSSVLLAAAALAPGVALADYSAIAFDSDGTGTSATKKTQEEANSSALKECNKGSWKMDCQLKFTKAIALVINPQDDDFAAYVPSLESAEDAKARALNLCTKPGCKLEKVVTTPGFWALAMSTNKEGTHQTYLTHGYDNFGEARADAVSRCEKLAGAKCERKWSGVIAGEHKPNAAAGPKKK